MFDLQELFRDPEKVDGDDKRLWYNSRYPGGFDPWRWDMVQTNKDLKQTFKF